MAPLVKSCCCCLSLRMGTILIGVFYIFCSCVGIAAAVRNLMSENKTESFPKNTTIVESDGTKTSMYQKDLVITIVSSILLGISGVFLICAAALENPIMIIPWVVANIVLVIGMSIYLIIMGEALLMYDLTYVFGKALLITVSIIMLVSLYFLIVVFSYGQLLRDSERNRQTEPM